MSQFMTYPALMMYSTAFLFSTGSVPGSPLHTGQHLEFGVPPKSAEQVQNTLELVESSACVSSPIVGKYELMPLPP